MKLMHNLVTVSCKHGGEGPLYIVACQEANGVDGSSIRPPASDLCRVESRVKMWFRDTWWLSVWEKKTKQSIIIARGNPLVKPYHRTFIHGIWNNTPNFNKYWKIPPKIIFLTPSQYAFPNKIKKTYFHYIFYSCIFSFEFLYSFIYLPNILTWYPSYDPTCILQCTLLISMYIVDAHYFSNNAIN